MKNESANVQDKKRILTWQQAHLIKTVHVKDGESISDLSDLEADIDIVASKYCNNGAGK